jgi:hypothetical protein
MLNCGVFFDIENLIGGYSSSSNGSIADLSLTDILGQIRSRPQVNGFSVMRAYANWSNPKLSLLRKQIVELGIDPVQVFGFDTDQSKNAADIQLAIDATELSIIRPAITTYAIVSGDGGFGALVRAFTSTVGT